MTHFAKTAAALSVVRLEPVRTLTVCVDGQRTLLATLHQSTVWLRSSWGFDGLSRFSYSLDGTHFTVVGAPYQLTWGDYRGDRIGLFTTGQDATPRGYADFSHFVYRVAR